MTLPSPFPPPLPSGRLRPDDHLKRAVATLEATTQQLVRSSQGGRAPPPPNWEDLHARLVHALSTGQMLPLPVRIHLTGLLAWCCSQADINTGGLAASLAEYYDNRGGAAPAKLAELLQWAPTDATVVRLWQEAGRPLKRPRFATWTWLLDIEWGRPVVPALAEQVVHKSLSNAELPTPLTRGFQTPLSIATWKSTFEKEPSAWRSRTRDELDWFLSSPDRVTAFILPLAECLLGPLAADLERLRRDLSDDGDTTWRISRIADELPKQGGEINESGLSDHVRRVLGIWRVVRNLEAFFSSWSGEPERKRFWRRYQGQVLNAHWYEHNGWIALKIGPRWYLEHCSGMVRVWSIEESLWPTVSERVANCPGGRLLTMEKRLMTGHRVPTGMNRILLNSYGRAKLAELLGPP